MDIVDLQMHEPGPGDFWLTRDHATRIEVLKEALLQMTDAIGVDRVALQPEVHLDFAEQVSQEYPDRFCSVPLLIDRGPAGERQGAIRDDAAPDLLEQLQAAAARPGVKGFRLMFSPGRVKKYEAGGYDHLLRCTAKVGLPLFLLCIGHVETAGKIIRAYPDLPVVIDHFAIPQPPMRVADASPWARLGDLLGLACFPNAYVKMCGAPSLSREGYPYHDAWPHVARVIEAFGVERLAWASDIGRFRGVIGWERFPQALQPYQGKHTYMESLAFFLYSDRLNASEKASILGETAKKLLAWP